MQRIIAFSVRRPWVVIFVTLASILALAHPATRVRSDSSVDTMLPADDPMRIYYDEVREQFGSDEVGVVGVFADSVYDAESLEAIRGLTESIEAIDGVESTLSLTNATNPIEDVLAPPPLVGRFPRDDAEERLLRERVEDLPIYRGNLVNAPGTAAAINVFFEIMDDDEFLARGIDQKIEALVREAERPGIRTAYTGLPHLKVHATLSMQRDLRRLVPVTLALIAAILFVSFRSIRGVALPVITVAFALVATLGIMQLTDGRLTLASTALPPLILVLGSVYSLHVISEYFEGARPGRASPDIALEAAEKTAPPVFLAALTTMLGFLSLMVNPIVSIQQMGLYSSIGIFVAFALAVTFVPAVLSALPPPRSAVSETFSPSVGRALARLGAFDTKHRIPLLVLGGVVAVLAIFQATRIQVDSNFQSFFDEDDPVRQHADAVNEALAGSSAFHVVIDGPEGAMREIDTLRRIRELQQAIDELEGVAKTVSFVDYAELLDRANRAGGDLIVDESGQVVEVPSATTTFWEAPKQLNGVFSLVASSPESFSRVVTPDFSRSDVIVRTSLIRASDVERLVGSIREAAVGIFPPEIEVVPTGTLVLHTKTTANVVRGQVQSLALATLVIFFIMAAMFLSVRVGMIAMLPNLFPILVFFGLMGATGAVLSLATSIIGSIVLGIAVDDTIHLMTRLSAEVRRTGDQEQALATTLVTVGKPVFFSTVFLAVGFLVLCFSSFVPIREFGALAAATIVVAFLADVVLLPAMIATTRIITLWDVLYVHLGRDPHRTIPIFATLRSWQAKIVALMGRLKTVPAGEAIVRQGDMGNEMYVIIRGRARVVAHVGGEDRVVRQLGRGDVFGEMGLIRHHERTADVIAEDDVELMAMDEEFLVRLQRRYPRTATRIFINVARILSDRLQDETHRTFPQPA